MDEIVFALIACLLSVTVIASIVYYRKLRQAQNEYERARSAVDDIVVSFNRQFKRQSERAESLGYKVESLTSKAESSFAMATEVANKMEAISKGKELDSQQVSQITQQMSDMTVRLRDAIASQEVLSARVSSLEQLPKQPGFSAEVSLEGVIPIKREKALAQLTNTEVAVLEMLASEGPKTAPEIKERVKLSREHTARLMKRLYEEGYLERETGKIPFKYAVKKEMEKLLKKTEGQTSQAV